ncbi:MaoC family dehydratase [Halosolutus amylolyticus]|uniref:MaoC family dehydratase n=1 Tax=Halosolutus amylolyticus TaxID=2932267 RepID=A0ABD5PIG5_9EURY|nr:MaoC family dehydratase [Halosolutus amylolyticus]
MKYFEDVKVGESYESRAVAVTEEDIVDFATQFDPQPFHTEPSAAKDTMFGDLVASGWHTAALCHRLSLEILNEAGWGAGIGRGIEELKWIDPLYVGDTLRIEYEIVDKSRDSSPDAYGNIRSRISGYNQHDECIITYRGNGMLQCRNSNVG